MKLNKRTLISQRQRLDTLIKNFASLKIQKPPRSGWLKSIRESLGLSAPKLAKRMNLKSGANVFSFEERELDGTITIQALQRAANAMDCRVIYAIVPNADSLESLLDERAQKVAREVLKKVSHSMKLEDQFPGDSELMHQEQQLAKELKEKMDARLWS